MEESHTVGALTLHMLLNRLGIDEKAREKIVLTRNPISNPNVKEIYEKGFMDYYLATQETGKFSGYDYMLAFIGEDTSARLYGFFKIVSEEPLSPKFMPQGYPKEQQKDFNEGTGSFYILEHDDRLKEFEKRLVIDWGKGFRTWKQNAANNDKKIISLSSEPFIGYDKVFLSYDELADRINDESWKTALSAVYGVYLISSPYGLYVGSATGDQGIYQRWQDYIDSYHGGDVMLIKLLEKHPNAYKEFRFSILKVLPKTKMRDDVVREEENFYKDMLRSNRIDPDNEFQEKFWGLNGN